MNVPTATTPINPLAAPAAPVGDRITVLRHSHNLLAKTWRADGAIEPYGDAKFFTWAEATVRDLRELARLLTQLERDPHRCVIRGRYVGNELAAFRDGEFQLGKVRRALDYFDDRPLHAVMFDVDKYEPLLADPAADPLEAIAEFIYLKLPEVFHRAGYYWQLSNSAGHPSKLDGELRVHLWFWLTTPRTSAELKAWARATGVPVDKAVFNSVQVHYTAAPVLEPGVVDPIPVRSGLVDGPAVDLDIAPELIAEAATGGGHVGRGQYLRGVAADDPVVPLLTIRSACRDGFNIVCPFVEDHSTGEGAETSTQYFLANTGGRALSNFKCMHDGCSGRTRTDYLAKLGADRPVDEFAEVVLTEAEADAAAEAAIRNASRTRPAKLKNERERFERERSVRIGSAGDAPALPRQRMWTGTEMLAELVLVEEGTRVSYADEPRRVLTFEELKKSTAGSVEYVVNEATGRKRKVSLAQLWLEHPDRKTVRAQTFAPGQPALCQSPADVPAQNLWRPRSTAAPDRWQSLVAPFFEHVAYLIPNEVERARFLDWIAHIEQAPGVLPSTHYLMVTEKHGIGRNWMAYALARAFSGYTAIGFDLAAALKSGFNGSLSQKLLAVVDELHEGGPGGANTPAAQKLKSMLTESTRLVNPKCGRQHIEFNCTRFLMLSNHAAALPLAANDRRVIVIENPTEPRSEDYFRRLYALFDEPDFGAALRESFRSRDLSAFNPGAPASMTEAKARTIRAGRSEVEQAVRDVASDWPSEVITSSRLSQAVSEALGGRLWNVQSASVAAGLVKYDGRHRVAGMPSHLWILRDFDVWRAAEAKVVIAEAVAGQQADDAADFG